MKLVLVTDDEQTIREITVSLLGKFGVEAIPASDGREAIYIVKTNPDIAIVILDKNMPVLNGISAYYCVRELNKTIPVFLISGEDTSDIKIDDPNLYIYQKPYNCMTFIQHIKSLLV